MKVLFLSSEKMSNGVNEGSAYLHRLHQLSSAIQEHGVRTEFLSLPEQPIGHPIFLQPLNFPFITNKAVGCDFIHAGGYAAYVAAFLKPLIKTRVIFDVHGDVVSEALLQKSANPNMMSSYYVLQARVCNSVACRGSDFYLAVSKPLQNRLKSEWNVPSDKIGLVRNGVDLQLFDRPSSKGASNGTFLVTYAGGFQCWQGLDNLIRAFALVPNEKIRLKIIGFTEKQSALKKSIREVLGNRVDLVDRMSQRELVPVLTESNILVIPRSHHRAIDVAFPTKFSEYLALRQPVLVTDVDETASLVREYSCGLVSEANPEDLAKTIRVASKLSQEELRQMGENGHRLAEKEFSWQVIGQKYFDTLAEWMTRDL
jgi:glycosyltransferase involved in cell wall biosynthesis